MRGFVKGQHTGNIIGIPRIVGRLTDEQIRDHYTYQARDGFGKEAIEELSRTEHKTPEEIRKICGLKERKDSEIMITPEIKAAIIADARVGLTAKKIAAIYDINEKTVEYHLCEARKRGELPPAKGSTKKHKKPEPVIEEPRTVVSNGERVTLPPDDPEPIPDKQPEAYPGQINDEDTKTADSPFDERNYIQGSVTQSNTLKEASKPRVTIGGKCLTGYKLQNVTAHACDISADWHIAGGLWQLLSVELAEHVRDILGEGSVCVERSYNEDSGKLKAVIKNADGRKYKLKLEEIK